MYKATRDFIKARQQFSKYVVEQVSVKQIDGGEPNDCFNNACDTIDRTKGIKLTSGWIIGKFNKFTNSTEIIQHFWNVDKDGNHFDTTPLIGSEFEYVIDCEINAYGQQHYDNVDSCVASSLLLKNGKFVAVDADQNGRLVYRNIGSLSTNKLFEKVSKGLEVDEASAYGRNTISIGEYMNFVMSQNSTFKIAA
jgi:hypothetical protein